MTQGVQADCPCHEGQAESLIVIRLAPSVDPRVLAL
jgi:hypothetical protein